jgi:hypothetical protein
MTKSDDSQQALIDLHRSMSERCLSTMIAKNNDYANPEHASNPFANFDASRVFGIHPAMGVLLRVQDKLKRIESFVRNGELCVSEESWMDSCEDVINYMVLMAAILKREADDE